MLAAFVIRILASRFTKPIKKMQRIAERMTNGNYAIKTNIKSQDEIDGVKVRGMNDLKKILIAHEVGDTVKLTVYGQNEPLSVVLGEQPRR